MESEGRKKNDCINNDLEGGNVTRAGIGIFSDSRAYFATTTNIIILYVHGCGLSLKHALLFEKFEDSGHRYLCPQGEWPFLNPLIPVFLNSKLSDRT